MFQFDMNSINVLADIGTNHRGNMALAQRMMRRIITAGAIPKIQLYNETTFPRKWADFLLTGTYFIPSVFKPADITFILPYNPLALKIASVEATYTELLDAALATTLPLYISTGGMNTIEMANLLDHVSSSWPTYDNQLCFMHCVSQYPTKLEHVNLIRIEQLGRITLRYSLDYILGLSLHCPTHTKEIFAAARAFGATQFEIHVRDSDMDSTNPDSLSAINLIYLSNLVDSINASNQYFGTGAMTGVDREDVLKWRQRWQN
jgi:sialic acid synthase SpsE